MLRPSVSFRDCSVTPIFSEAAYTTDTRFGNAEEHIALLEFLCEHGAQVPQVPDARLARINASLCLIAKQSDKGAVLAWLLRKGLPMSDADKQDTVGFLLHKDRGRDICEALQAEGLLPPAGKKRGKSL